MLLQRTRAGQRGFTLLVVALLMIVLGLTGMSILQVIRLDLSLVNSARRVMEARDSAEGGVMELINDLRTPSYLPDFGSTSLKTSLSGAQLPSNSPFIDTTGRSYTAEIRFLRIIPVAESSLAWTRALVYEVGAEGTVRGEASANVRSEVYRTVAFEPGTILPSRHNR